MKLEVIVLAAGKGTRMRSDKPKVLHRLAGRPLLSHVLDTAASLGADRLHVVVGHGAGQVREHYAGRPISWVEQREQLGTGHAVLQALPEVDDDATVLVLYGDVPLLSADTLRPLVAAASDTMALLTAEVAEPAGYGRIVRGAAGEFRAVVEERDASAEDRAIHEINSGVLAAPAALLKEYLPRVGNDNSQGEYYLPEALSLHVASGATVATSLAATELEILGVNDRLQLAEVERAYQQGLARQLLLDGVQLADPARIDIRGSLRCGRDVFIDIDAVFEGEVTLGDNVTIGPNCVLIDTQVGDGATVHAMSHLQEAEVGGHCNVGPYARLRPGTALADGARVGNFVETKKARVGAGSKINHLSYIGDCEMGGGVNIGAGTITCNYDGANKHLTAIGDGVFVGSNSTLVAPVEISAGGFVAAGSTVTKGVGEDELAVARGRQRNIQGWTRPQKQED
ncbi:bifunctional UDP-N-acetylglucosamine diphosphorylase/glucosamine-1-phosphate N-acetyltransferase GlmU [Parahaliea mediterranea]|uniref:Bifunctional protein GlmU n=1 Tax=Parahaliea mediterranea TaxID=651086 RepID=A0A939IMM5_9GAMM|nr:bifunctional UDP-N-acetylglucosamine diphosphorylase/glucosamine-1-phosphate N-acetyltransferase GlmU [Parahaliea mediterranea]MBN7797193.1 bifunctional UDP-N-acetylglucosamine diphosphorylase/glucosamine-1-phosphate N-acetyltransferase GlmU [Parahaliea mediterranea]